MCSAHFIEDLDPGAEIKVISIVEDQCDSQCLHLLRGQTLDSRLSSYRHKCGQQGHSICGS